MSSGKKSFRVGPSNPQIDPVDLTAAEVRNLIGLCIKFINPFGRVTRKFAAAAPARDRPERRWGKDSQPSHRRGLGPSCGSLGRVAETVLALGYEPRPRAASSSAPAASRYDAGARNLPQLSVGPPPSGKVWITDVSQYIVASANSWPSGYRLSDTWPRIREAT